MWPYHYDYDLYLCVYHFIVSSHFPESSSLLLPQCSKLINCKIWSTLCRTDSQTQKDISLSSRRSRKLSSSSPGPVLVRSWSFQSNRTQTQMTWTRVWFYCQAQVQIQSRSIPDLFEVILIYSNSRSDDLDQELMLFLLCHHPPLNFSRAGEDPKPIQNDF